MSVMVVAGDTERGHNTEEKWSESTNLSFCLNGGGKERKGKEKQKIVNLEGGEVVARITGMT